MEPCKYGCNGLRHKQESGSDKWVKCECLLIEERNALCTAARIPADYWDLTLQGLKALTPTLKQAKNQLLPLAAILKTGQLPGQRFYVISGKPPSHKIIGYLLLKAALFKHRGITCGLDELATWFLSADKISFNEVRNAPVLVLAFGDEYTQQVHKYLLKHVLEYRSEPRFFTVFVTSLSQPGVQQVYERHELWTSPQAWIVVNEELQI